MRHRVRYASRKSRLVGRVRVRRIVATRDIPTHGVRAGDVGGFISRRVRLYDDAWVGGDAVVIGPCHLHDQALVTGAAEVREYVDMFDDAVVAGRGRVAGARGMPTGLMGSSIVGDDASVAPGSLIDDTLLYDSGRVGDSALSGSWVRDRGVVISTAATDSCVDGDALVENCAIDRLRVRGTSRVIGGTDLCLVVDGPATVTGDARIGSNADVRVLGGDIAVYRTEGGIAVTRGDDLFRSNTDGVPTDIGAAEMWAHRLLP